MVRQSTPDVRRRQLALLAGISLALALLAGSKMRGADQTPPSALPIFQQYCYDCHGNGIATAGVSFDKLTAATSVADTYQIWERVVTALEQKRMPPKGNPQPTDEERGHAIAWIHSQLEAYVKTHAGDPGRVTVRRLTSGEYKYTVHDLIGLDLDLGIDSSNDSVGGEGFTNFGDVQFMQDASLQRYLEAAKIIADHAVVGAGPLQFFADPGKSGFEMSGITRVKDIYSTYGFRTVSGEGGFAFGLERYTKALFAAWEYQHRAAIGEPNATFATFAGREGVTARFAQYMYTVMNRKDLAYPSSEMAARYQKLPAPTANVKESLAAARKGCDDLQKFITSWPSWLFARGDAAFGGAGDESPLIINDKSLKAEASHHFVYGRGTRLPTPGAGGAGRGGANPGRGDAAPPTGAALPNGATPPPGGGAGRGGFGGRGAAAPTTPGLGRIYLFASPVNPTAKGKPVVIWRNPTVSFRAGFGRGPAAATNGNGADDPNAPPPADAGGGGGATVAVATVAGATPPAGGRRGAPAAPRIPLRAAVTEDCAKKLNFGTSPDGAPIGPDDFASDLSSVPIEVTVPAGMSGFDFQADAQVGADPDQVFRIIITDREDGGSRGIPVRAIVGNPTSAGFQAFKAGVLQLADILPPNSNSEPTPADKDPPPEPFDPTYNVPEHDAFDNDVKYVRNDKFIYNNILDDATRAKVDQAWNDVYASFEYHDHYLKLIAEHYNVDLKGKHIGELTKADFAAMPAEARQYAESLRATYDSAHAAELAAQSRHIADCLEFASRAWRRPLTAQEKQSLRNFYEKSFAEDPDHTRAIKTLITRILLAPEFLYKLEPGNATNAAVIKKIAAVTPSVQPLDSWEMSSRLSYFIWSSIPDDELRRAAAAGELTDPQQLRKQAKRMLADPKARRLSTEFFGQWLGFYQFDQFKGVDTSRFPEFTSEVQASMYDEATSFFEYIIRNDRPVSDLLNADYDFLNTTLAKYYAIKADVKSSGPVEMVTGANSFNRGGLLRLGAILATTSAPLRTSPVRRGDWVLRRILGTAVPPPPADAGSIPADPKLFGGLSVRERLQVHKRNATCATCHTRIDPLGFPLEHFDSTGRWREKYEDGKTIDDFGTTNDNTTITGVAGLLDYLQKQQDQVQRTLAHKLIGYAFGRTLQLSDQTLLDSLVKAGNQAGMSTLVGDIVTSKQFRNRVVQDDSAPTTAPAHRASAQTPGPSRRVPNSNAPNNAAAALPAVGEESTNPNQVGKR